MIVHSNTSADVLASVAKDDSEKDDDQSPRSYIKCFRIAARNISNEKENMGRTGTIEQHVKTTQNPANRRKLLTEKRIQERGGNCEQKTSQKAVAASKLKVNPTNRVGAALVQQV